MLEAKMILIEEDIQYYEVDGGMENGGDFKSVVSRGYVWVFYLFKVLGNAKIMTETRL